LVSGLLSSLPVLEILQVLASSGMSLEGAELANGGEEDE
jgi:hypothetical protein